MKTKRSSLLSLLFGLILAAPILASPSGPEDGTEELFDAARAYTVRLRVSVPRAFVPDQRGTHRGAGFVIDAERGWILTNAHVVARSPSHVEAALQGQPFVDADKVYVDPHLDLAILQIPLPRANKLASAQLDCSDHPKIGHPVGAFGHPWNLFFTGTRGIISGVTVQEGTELLQTDAPINSGNSGGPLISLRTGKIVGINTAQIRGSQNTNFALSVKYACRVVELLRAGQDPSPPDLRVAWFQDTDGARSLKVARNYGSDFPLIAGDTLLRVGDASGTIENETQLDHLLRGRTGLLHLIVTRGSTQVDLAGILKPMAKTVDVRGVVAGGVLFGLNPLRDAAELQAGHIMIHNVDSGSEGEAKELARGDFVEFVNGKPVRSLEELYERLASATSPVILAIKRYGTGDQVCQYLERKLSPGKPGWVGSAPGPAGTADATSAQPPDRH